MRTFLLSTVAISGILPWAASSYAGACDSAPYSCTYLQLDAQASATGSGLPAIPPLDSHSVKRPLKRPDRAYPLVKNQEYAYAYDWECRSG